MDPSDRVHLLTAESPTNFSLSLLPQGDVFVNRQTEGTSEQVSSTRSVGMNLARRFNAGARVSAGSRRVATVEFLGFQASPCDANTSLAFSRPLKGRAKFRSTLRVESTCSEFPEVCRTSRRF